MIPLLDTPGDRLVDRLSLEALRTVLPSIGNPTRQILGIILPATVPTKATFVFVMENLGCTRIEANPLVHGGHVHCQKTTHLTTVGRQSRVASKSQPFMVLDPSNNVEFLADTGSSISLLLVKNFASCGHYSGLQTLSAINNPLHSTKHLHVQLPTGAIISYPRTFKVANVEMAILGCDFLAFHDLQLDFTEMLLVDPHVIGSHDEHVIQESQLDKAKGRSPPQPFINEVDSLSITCDINVLSV